MMVEQANCCSCSTPRRVNDCFAVVRNAHWTQLMSDEKSDNVDPWGPCPRLIVAGYPLMCELGWRLNI